MKIRSAVNVLFIVYDSIRLGKKLLREKSIHQTLSPFFQRQSSSSVGLELLSFRGNELVDFMVDHFGNFQVNWQPSK